jgi:parvulin-like peptidyl-prolyl isomerase
LKKLVRALLAGAVLAGGFNYARAANAPANIPPAQPLTMDEVVATVKDKPLTMRQLVQPLVEAHGLVMLMNLVRLEVARQWAVQWKFTVGPEDIAKQRQLTLDAMFKDNKPDQQNQEKLADALARGDKDQADKIRAAINFDREEFLNRLLEEQHLSRVDYEMIVQINAYLRKRAEQMIQNTITEDNVRAAFGQLYGEHARVKYIELLNMEQVTIAKRRLDAGDKFEDVARDMSLQRQSGALGGEAPLFTRSEPSLPENFKEVAFALKPGEVSDPVSLGTHFVLIKLIEKVAPKAIKYEAVKASVRENLYNNLLGATMNDLRRQLDTQALADVKIQEPTLKKQFQQAQDRQIHDRQKMNDAMERDRLNDQRGNGPTSRPFGGIPGLTTAPSSAQAAPQGAPPATQPGAVPIQTQSH